jgi:uncharacterized Tic20 family protein
MSTPGVTSYPPPPPLPPLHPAEERQYALLTHLLSIFFGFVPALIFFVLYRDRGPFVRDHTVTEWNFQLTGLIAQGVGFAIAIIGWSTAVASAFTESSAPHGVPAGLILFLIGYAFNLVVVVIRVIFGIIASVAANKGRFYRYRFAIRFVRE